MTHYFKILLALSSLFGGFITNQILAQEKALLISGRISFITSQNAYAKFKSTEGINIGDTLFLTAENKRIPAILVENKSSLSCAGRILGSLVLKIDDPLSAEIHNNYTQLAIKENEFIKPDEVSVNDQIIQETKREPVKLERKQEIRGRASIASYTNFSNTNTSNTQRMRYNLSLAANHVGNSRFSAESYISFSHKLSDWSSVQENLFNALKIYSLSAQYEVTDNTTVWFGRKINPKTSNIGVVDGAQGETRWKNFSLGAVVGSRPDYSDYSYNFNLLEYGGYISHSAKTTTGNAQTSLAFFNQTNSGLTDRRFVYLQHDNSLVQNLFLFTSCEIDLYKIVNDIPTTTPSLTSLYFSLRYRVSSKLSAFASFDARKNVIYYETFKNYIDQLLDDAMRQGWQLRINYRPWTKVIMGLSGGYRYRDGDLRATRNVNGFLTFSRIPGLNASASLTANVLQTSYLDGMVFGARLSKDYFRGKLSTSLNYRFIDYTYLQSGSTLFQHIAETSLNWQFSKKISLSLDYEITFDKTNLYNRIYLNFVTRL